MRYRVRSALVAITAAMLLGSGAMLAPLAASAVVIDWVTVGTPGNAADTRYMNCGPLGASGSSNASPCGAVAYTYEIGKYEVTNAQYAEFLNAVAATDTNALYSTSMDSDPQLGTTAFSGITRSGVSGSYSYSVKSGFASKPVTHISFWDAARFSNWLQNGQPTGLQTAATTEDGAYTLTPEAIAANSVLRNPTASVFLPSENEWYKAAYYDPIAGLYYDYPTGTNAIIGCVAPGDDTGNSANCGNPISIAVLTNVGAYVLSDSPSGTFDQGGNDWEWHEQIKYGEFRGLRGGAWINNPISLAAGHSSKLLPSNEYSHLGFRIASIPEQCEIDLGQCGIDLFACEAAKNECTADLVVANAALGQAGALLDQCTINENQCQAALAQSGASLDACTADLAIESAALSGAQTSLNQCTDTRDQCQASLSQSQSLLVQCSADLAQAGGSLAACNTNLAQAGVALAESAAALGQCSSSLQESVANLASTTAELGATEAALASMTQERDAAAAKISEQDAKIRSLQTRLDTCEGHPPNLACQADLSGDGMVNFKDLGLFKSVFFKKCEPTP